ncbi:flagellar export protein FliJ [bacterium]|jgi:flagellar export protein FliJ|nr:flagellar export protein FliJ [bacterium]
MRKFHFELEAVERVRKAKEEEALRSLGVAQRALVRERERRDSLFKDLANSLNRREQLGASGEISSTAIQMETDFVEGTKKRIIQAEHTCMRAQKAVDKAMRGYLQARRQTRMIEVLRERAFESYKKAAAKREQKDMDDLNIMRARILKEGRA